MIRNKKEMKKRVEKGDKKKKDKTMGTFPLSEILSGNKDKNFGETYSIVLKTSLYVSKNVTICFHNFFLDYQQVFYNNYSDVF